LSYPGKGVIDGEGGVVRIKKANKDEEARWGFSCIFSGQIWLKKAEESGDCPVREAVSISDR
jgi:hypothetical protein